MINNLNETQNSKRGKSEEQKKEADITLLENSKSTLLYK